MSHLGRGGSHGDSTAVGRGSWSCVQEKTALRACPHSMRYELLSWSGQQAMRHHLDSAPCTQFLMAQGETDLKVIPSHRPRTKNDENRHSTTHSGQRRRARPVTEPLTHPRLMRRTLSARLERRSHSIWRRPVQIGHLEIPSREILAPHHHCALKTARAFNVVF